jgi:hypothetical protein
VISQVIFTDSPEMLPGKTYIPEKIRAYWLVIKGRFIQMICCSSEKLVIFKTY